jgi:putative hydrolase of the HAD superfamily
MFQTLVDVNSLRHHFWQKVLGSNYSEARVDDYTEQWGKLFPDHFNLTAASGTNGFLSLKPVFEIFWNKFFKKFNIDFDHRKAARIHVDVHRLAPPYEDTEVFLNTIRGHFPICLVTDSDCEMVQPHLDKYGFDQVFISERLRAYKGDSENRMFQAVARHYSIPSETIFHIGDMYSDIAGANQAGMTTCWINRDGKSWNYCDKPDYEVKSLSEAADILGRPIEHKEALNSRYLL